MEIYKEIYENDDECFDFTVKNITLLVEKAGLDKCKYFTFDIDYFYGEVAINILEILTDSGVTFEEVKIDQDTLISTLVGTLPR